MTAIHVINALIELAPSDMAERTQPDYQLPPPDPQR